MPFFMRKTLQQFTKLLLLAIVLVSGNAWGQIIARDQFETTASSPSIGFTFSGGTYQTGNTGTSTSTNSPANSPKYSEGARGYGVTNGSATLTSADINTSNYTSVAFSCKLASFSTPGSSTNGADTADYVKVEISPDGGATYYVRLWQTGSGNTTWAFSNTGTYTNTYSTSNLSSSGNSAAAKTLTITGLPSASNLRVRITMLNNSSDELWVIDDVQLTGTIAGSTITTGNSGVLSGALTATYGTASATPRTATVTGTSLTANITATAATNFEVSSDNNTWGSTATFTQTSGSASGTLYVRLVATAPVSGSYNNITAATLSSTGATNVLVKTTTSGNSVTAKSLTITGLTGNDKVYDGTATATFSGTPAYSGLVNGETFSVTGTASALFTSPTPAANVGSGKTITVSGYTAPSTNYSVTQPTLTGNITAATPTITATGTATYTYSGSAQGPASATTTGTSTTYTYSYSGTDNSGATYGPSATKPANAGTYQVIATAAATTNYTTASSAPLNFIINKAGSAITVTGNDSFVYAADTPQGPNTYTATAGSTGAVTFVYTSTDGAGYSSSTLPTAVGAYQAVATLAADNNYNGATSAAFAFDITSVALPAISGAATATATYGVAIATYTLTITENPTTVNVTGLPAGLSLSQVAPYQITGTPTVAPGTYSVTVTATNQGGTGDPFTFTITVAAKALTIAGVSVDDKIYDGTNTATLNGTLSGVVTGDESLVTLNKTAAFASVNAGTGITVTSTSTLSGTKASYYLLTQPTGLTASITKVTPTVTASGTTTYTYTGSVQGPASATVTPSAAGTATYSYTGTTYGGVAYGPTATRPTNAGTYTVTASVAETTNYNAASSAPLAFTIAKRNQALTLNNLIKTSTDAAFTLASTTTTGGLTVSYSSGNTAVATISGNTVTITGVGTTTISATQAGDNNNNAFSTSFTLTVNFASTVVPVATPATQINNSSFTANWNALTGAASYILDVYTKTTSTTTILDQNFNWASGGNSTVTQTINNTSIAIGSSTMLATVIDANSTLTGWAASTLTQADGCIKGGSSNTAGSITTPALTGLSGIGTLTFKAAKYIGNGNSGDSTSLTVTISGGGTISGNTSIPSSSLTTSTWTTYTVNISGGTSSTKLTISSSTGDQRFLLDDIKVTTTITTNNPVTGSPFTVAAPTTSYNVTGLTPNTTYYYTVKGVNGSSTTTASTEITAATIATPTLSINNNNAVYTGSPIAVQLGVVNSTGGTLQNILYNGSTTVPTNAGTYAITADVGATGNNAAITGISAGNFVIAKASQTIVFNALAEKTTTDADFAPGATASSGLTVSYTSSNQSVATILNGNIHIVGAGTTTITASQAGNGNYNAASDVPQTLLVSVPATTWNGTAWSNGVPGVAINALIQAPYTEDAGFEAANLTVNAKLTIKTGKTITVHSALVATDSIIVQNNAALVLKEGATQSGSGIGKTKVTRLANPLFRLDYTMWGSPVTGSQTLLDFSPNTATNPNRFYIYGYNDTQEAYLNVPSPQTATFAKGKGYLIRMPNSLTLEGYNTGGTQLAYPGIFKGTPNNGDIDVKIVDTDAGTNFSGHYISVSNPYPSPISVKAFFDANEDVLDTATTMYFWRKKNDATSATTSYAKLNLNGYTKNTNSLAGGGDIDGLGQNFYTGDTSAWVLSPGQGFLIKLKTNLTATQYVKFRNSMRRSVTLITDANGNPNQPFFKTQNNNDTPAESRWWMNLTGTGDAFSQALVGYLPQATLNIDFALDGLSFNDAGTRLYSSQQGGNFGIQARPSFTDTDVVALGYAVGTAGQYTLTLDRVEGVFAQGQAIYIKDNMLGTVSNISETGNYTFTTSNGTFDTRFEVIYQPQGQLETTNPELENMVLVYQSNGAINITTGNVEMKGVILYDIRGRKLYEQSGINATEASVSNLNTAHQVIIVEIDTVNGKVSKKIVY